MEAEAAEKKRQREIGLNTAKAKAAYLAKQKGEDPDGAAARAEREFIEKMAKEDALAKDKEAEQAQLAAQAAQTAQLAEESEETEEDAAFEAAKRAAMQANKGRRGDFLHFFDF